MDDEPEEQPAAVSDPPSFPEPDVWKFAKFVMRLLGKLTFAVGTSVGAALILLVGGNSVLSFGILGLLFVIALLTTAVKLVLLFLACTIVSFLALAAIVRASAYASSRRIAVVKRWGCMWSNGEFVRQCSECEHSLAQSLERNRSRPFTESF